MKKFTLTTFLIILCFLICVNLKYFINKDQKIIPKNSIFKFANKSTPTKFDLGYKKEIEAIINSEYIVVIKKADECVKDAEQLYKNLIQKGYSDSDYINLIQIYEMELPFVDLELYTKLTKITQEKYLNYQYRPIATDNSNPYYDYLYPYFKANNININKIVKLNEYIEQQQKIIKNYIDEIDKMRKP